MHPHWKVLVRPVSLAFLIVAVPLVAEVLIPAGAAAADRLALAGVAIVLLMWWLAFPLLRWRTTTYELTTRRMRMRYGIIARNGKDIPLSRITDVSFRRGRSTDAWLGTLMVDHPDGRSSCSPRSRMSNISSPRCSSSSRTSSSQPAGMSGGRSTKPGP